MSARGLVVLSVCLFVCLVGACRRAPQSVAGVPVCAFEPLTEDDVALFLNVLPKVTGYLHLRYHPPETKVSDSISTYFRKKVEALGDAPGLDSVLQANGTDWPWFRAMMYRVIVTVTARGREQAEANMQQSLRRARPGVVRNVKRQMRDMERIAAHVPARNLEVFARHARELADIGWLLGE